jgi:predicted metal-binding membrane protein
MAESALSFALRRDRVVVLVALVAVAALAWAYLIVLAARMGAPSAGAASGMPGMPGMQMSGAGLLVPAFVPWTAAHFLFMFTMWAVMMVGMMTPSVAPMVLVYTEVARRSATRGYAFAPPGWFAAGYLIAWSLFSALAALAQWGLEALALITPMMASASRPFGGAVLIAAGVYQWLPIKYACLSQCRAPLAFVQRHGGFQESAWGSLRLGLLHGAYCIGCCWALMALLFVGGVMNLLWVAALMIFVLLEKAIPGARYVSPIAGLVAVVAGIWMIVT